MLTLIRYGDDVVKVYRSDNPLMQLESHLRPRISSGPCSCAIRERAATSYPCVTMACVRVTVPRWGSLREARAFASEQQGWIDRQRQRLEYSEGDDARRARAGETRGLGTRQSANCRRGSLTLAAGLGLAVSKVSVRNQKWRWGSCSRQGPHLPELAPRGHAGLGARLRDDPRADAPAADESLAKILEAGRRRLPRLPVRAALAAREWSLAVRL